MCGKWLSEKQSAGMHFRNVCSCQLALASSATRPGEQHLPFALLLLLHPMAAAEEGQFLRQATGRNTRGLLRVIILCLIAGAAVSSRLFSVIRFESIIHECQCRHFCNAWRTGRREQLANIRSQSTRGSTSARPSTWCRMASTTSGTGSTTVGSHITLHAVFPTARPTNLRVQEHGTPSAASRAVPSTPASW